MIFPQKNNVYTFKEIATLLELPDSPFLQFEYDDTECIIQTSHVTCEELLNISGMSESLWIYEKTTEECIPLFWYSDNNIIDILALVDIVEIDGGDGGEKDYSKIYSVTPKGYQR